MHNETVFHGILNSDLPLSDKTPNRLQQEAQLVVNAGQDTVGQCAISALCSIMILRKERLNTVCHNVSTSYKSRQASKAQRRARGRYPRSKCRSHVCYSRETPVSFCCDSGRSALTPGGYRALATCLSGRGPCVQRQIDEERMVNSSWHRRQYGCPNYKHEFDRVPGAAKFCAGAVD